MNELREQYKKLISRRNVRPARSDTSGVLPSKAPLNMSKAMLEKYIMWYEQVNKQGKSSLTLDKKILVTTTIT